MASTYPFSTTWTGAGDGKTWEDPANWSNGVPLPAAQASQGNQDVATVDNSIETAPFTLNINGNASAGEIDIDLADPAGGAPAVVLTGTLAMSTNVTDSGSGFGLIDLKAGTFEIDGTLTGAEVNQDGGTLVFGSAASVGAITLGGDIIDGTLNLDNGSTIVMAASNGTVFQGLNGAGADVILSNGSTLSTVGSIYVSGLVDVQDGGTLSLDGGALNGWTLPATLYADGGAINVTQGFSVNGKYTLEGAVTFETAATISVAAGADLIFKAPPGAATTVIDLNGSTIDVTGALNLANTTLTNGTIILEAGSTYSADSASSLSGVTLTDDRPAGQTNWTGAAGDGDWSNAANWTNGVPQSGLGFSSDNQSVAVVNNLINPTPSTIVIADTVNAEDIYLNTTDPSSGPSISLTGSLDTSYNGEGGAYGSLDLLAGTFEIDGGTLSYTGVGLNGGNLAFGTAPNTVETLHTDIINGNFTINRSQVELIGYNIFHGQYGGGPSTTTLTGGADLIVANGTLAIDGTLDIQDGGDGTLFALDGGNLQGYGGDNGANIFIDGGTFAIDASTTFSNEVNIYGGYMVVGNTDAVPVITIDASSVTTIGQAGAAQTIVNLNGATLDVFGTLNLTNTYIENGTIIVEPGATFNQDATDTLENVTVTGGLQTATNWTGGGDGTTWDDPANWDNGVPVAGGAYPTLGQNVTTIDNTHGASDPFTVVMNGNEVGALVIVNATDPVGDVAVRLEGSLDLDFNENNGSGTLGVLDVNGGTFEIDGGSLNVLSVNQLGGQVTFGSFAQWGAATLNAAGIGGDLTIGNASELIIAANSFGAFNQQYPPTINTVTITDNSTLDIQGSLYSANTIDIVSGSVILDGGSLNMGSGAKLVSEGGVLTVKGSGTLDTVEYDGAVDIGANNQLTIASGQTALISNPTGPYAINLDSGNLDVAGTLYVDGIITGMGTLSLDGGSTLMDATVKATGTSQTPNINITGNATLDNTAVDASIELGAGVTLTAAGADTFGNAADAAPMTVDLNGGTLDVTGTLNLANTAISAGTIIVEAGGSLTMDAATTLDGVTVEKKLADGGLQIIGQDALITSLQAITPAQTIALQTGVDGNGTPSGTAGEVTFGDPTGDGNPVGFTGAGTVTVTDGSGVSFTDFNGATLAATVAGQTLDIATDTYSANGGSFSAINGGKLVIGDANYQSSNLVGGVINAGLSATGGSTVQFYGAQGIAVVNGLTTLDATSTIAVATAVGTVSLAQSLTSIGSQNPATGFDQLGILDLNGGASFIDPNAVTLYGTVNLTGGTFSTAGLTGNTVVFGSGFGTIYASGVQGYGTLNGAFGSTSGDIYMEASGGTLTYTGMLAGFDNLIADANSTLVVNAAIDSSGYTNGYGINMKAGSTVELNGAIGDTTNVYTSFAGSNATLQLDDVTGVTYKNIQAGGGAYSNDVIDLAGLVAATLPDGSPNVTITRYVDGTVTVSIVPVGGGAADVFTIANAANTKVTFNPYDGKGGSQILLSADPVITAPGYVNATQGIASAISGVSVADAALASGQTLTVTVDDVNGLLSATGATGSGTKSLSITGTLAQVNAALATLTVLESTLGADALAVSAVDSAGNSAATQTFQIGTTPPIVIGSDTAQTVAQNVATKFAGPYVYEQGALSGADLTVTVSVTTGILTETGTGISGSGTHTITFTGSQEAVNADLVALTIIETAPGNDTVTFNASDAAGDKAPTATAVISTLPTPTITAPASAAVSQNSITPLTGYSISEPGAQPYDLFTVTLSDTTGLLSATGAATTGFGATSITLTGTLAQINADLATLAIDEQGVGSDTLNMTLTDTYGGTATHSETIGSTHLAAPDLTVGAITAPSSGLEGQSVQVTWTVTNSGDATATGPWTDNVYVASDATGTTKTLVGSFTYTGTLAVGQSETQTQTVTLPNTFPLGAIGAASTYFVVQTDATNSIGELSGIQNHVTVAATPTVTTATIDWAAVFASAATSDIDATDYALVEQRFVAEVGTTDASFQAAIKTVMTALDAASATPATTNDAIKALLQEAFGQSISGPLAQVLVPGVTETGLNALLTPEYDSSIATRNSGGAFGDGWVSEFNDVGALGPVNAAGTYDRGPAGGVYTVEYVTTYVDQYGNYLGQSISYQVVSPPSLGVSLLDPTNRNSNYTQTNANGTIETFDGKTGLLIGISDGQGNAIAIARNAAGTITGITTAAGHPTKFTVNANGNITSATDSAGNTVTYTYDASDTHLLGTTNSAGTTSYQYSTSSNAFITNALTQVTNPDGTSNAYTYNSQGDLSGVSVNGAAPTTYTYSGTNSVTRTNGDGQATTYTYDANNQLTSITDAGGHTYTIQRDASGNATSVTLPSGATTGYIYDASGNVTQVTDGLGNTVQTTYAAGTSSVTSITDPNGNQTQYAYNTAGQVSGVVQANGSGTQFEYNAAGQVTKQTDASGATIQYTYNAAGKVTNEAFSDGTSQSYTYDAKKNLTSSTAIDGSKTTYAYNAQGLLASVTNAAGQVESYSYNASGQETQRVEPDGSITNYSYTAAGQLAQITDGTGATIARYTYDAAGSLIEKDTGNGASTLYTHDASGNVTEIKTLASDGSTTSKTDYTYDADNRIATAVSGDGKWAYTYDADNRLTHAVFTSTNTAIPNQDLAYQYDAAGNRTATVFNGATTNYTTNNLNQYTSADGTTYGYDANGNLATKTSGGATTTYTYNTLNELTSSTDATGTTTYTYDALGNIASQTVNGVKTSYVSDPLAISSSATGALSAVAQAYNASGQATATYVYGNGLTSVTSSGTTSYYNADASGNITSLSGANGALTQTYVYSPTGTVINATGSVANPFQFNGAVGAITQSNGLVDTRARYYDPTTGRFISEDPTGQTNGYNVYTYAADNPVNYIDASGDSISPFGFVTGVIGFVVAGAGLVVATGALPITLGVVGVISGGRSIYQSLTVKDGGSTFSIHQDNAQDYIDGTTSLVLNVAGGKQYLRFGGEELKDGAKTAYDIISNTNSLWGNYSGKNVFSSIADGVTDAFIKLVYGTDTVDVPSGGGWGDVHLTTFDGLHYNFQAVGEFVLAKSMVPGDNFQVQIRLSALGGDESAPTLTTEIGIQVGNQTITFAADRSATFYVDGVPTDLNQSNTTLALAGGTITVLSANSYVVTEKTGEVINITNNGQYFSYTVDLAPGAKAGSVEGLLGSYSGTANSFQLPDGTTLGATLTSDQLYQIFGNAWRITDATSLLNYGTGETTATYTDLAHPTTELDISTLPTAVVQAATAAVAAAGLTGTAAADALYDYLVTGNPSLITNAATDGAQAPVTSSAVVTPAAPPPPSIGISPAAPLVAEVANQTPVTFTVNLTSTATADTVVNYTVSGALDDGKSYFNAADFGGTLPSGTVTILAGQSTAQITIEVPDSALGTTPDKWLGVAISTTGTDPVYASTAQVDVVNNQPVAGVAAQPVLEYVSYNPLGITQNAPTLTHSGSSYTLDLGNVVQGSAIGAMQFAMANLASAPADGLSTLLLGTTGTGFNTAGLAAATLITAGKALNALTVQALTGTLGAQSSVVTFGATDVNGSGYAGALSNITLTVKENVIAAAQANLGATTIALADARVGSTDTQAISVTNSAAAGAASLDVTTGATSGATATGSISKLTAGSTDVTSIAVGVSTATAGLHTGTVTLNLASDLGNGVQAPLLANPSITVAGAVYRAATATTAQAATIVHVGDTGSQVLSITNSDAADGYSEGLRATVAGTTGAVTATGTTGLIAAGATDATSVKLGYSTATSGVISGQVKLGLTSDGTGVDSLAPISIGTDTVAFSVQVDNYAKADLHETSGGGTLTGSAATGYDLDLGTLAQGAGADTIDLAALNSASGLADLLAGTFGVTADTPSTAAFTNTGFGAFSALGAGQADNALSVSLSTANDGTFSETITLTGTGSNASGYSGTVAPVTLTIHGTIASPAVAVTGGTFTGAITEQAGKTGSASADAVQGDIAFTDGNHAATHTATVLGVSATGVTTGLPGNSALLSLFSTGLTEEVNSTPGDVTWYFNAADSTFDYLAAGQTLTLTYAVQIAQNGGAAVTQNVSVTVTGTNDVPVIASGTTSSASIAAIVAGPTTPANDTASGAIRFTDADLADTHTATVASVAATGTVAGLPSNATLLALLGTTAVTEQSGATAGSVGWNFSAPDATFAYLAAGQSVTLTYTVDVSDNHGGTVAQAVTVTVTGAGDTVKHSATSGTVLGTAYASSDKSYTASGFLDLQTFYNASGAVVATESFTANGGYTITIGGQVAQIQTKNPDGTYAIQTYGAGTFHGVAYASHTNAYTSSNFVFLQTYYDGAGNVIGTESRSADGGYVDTVGGKPFQSKTVNPDGSYDGFYYTAGTILGTAYASWDKSYTAAGFLQLQTFYNASGAVVATESFAANGGTTITVGGHAAQIQTINSDGSYAIQTYGAGTFHGVAYVSHTNAYTSSNFVTLQTYYDGAGNVIGTESRSANGGFVDTVGGVIVQSKTVNSDGSYDGFFRTTGSILGAAYASWDKAYTAAGFLYLQTFYNASGVEVATESFAANGDHVITTITVGGQVAQIQTVSVDGSYTIQTYATGTFHGVAYSSHTNAYTSSNFITLQTYYDAKGNVIGTESRTPDGGYVDTVGGKPFQSKTVNSDGSYDGFYYAAATFQGTAYAYWDKSYTASGFLQLQTFYNASGAVVATESFTPDGGYTITIGGQVAQIQTVNPDGSYTVQAFGAGTFHGVAYASHTNAYTSSNAVVLQTYYDAKGNVIGTESRTANGGYIDSIGGAVIQSRTVNPDGSYVMENDQVTGQAYTQSHVAYNASGAAIAVSEIMTNATNTTALKASALTLTIAGGIESVSNGADTLQLGADTGGALNITGAANATLAFGTGAGAQVVTGFATSGGGADALSFSTSVFANYAHLMGATTQQGSDLLITLDASDTILLKNVSASSFTSANVHFT